MTTSSSEGDLLLIEILTIKKVHKICLKRNFFKKNPEKTHSSKSNTAQCGKLKDNDGKKANISIFLKLCFFQVDFPKTIDRKSIRLRYTKITFTEVRKHVLDCLLLFYHCRCSERVPPFVYKWLLCDEKAEEQAWNWEALCHLRQAGQYFSHSLAHTLSGASFTILSQWS